MDDVRDQSPEKAPKPVAASLCRTPAARPVRMPQTPWGERITTNGGLNHRDGAA